MGMRWWAAKGSGARANGQLIHVSDVTELQDAHMSFSQLAEWDSLGLLQKVSDLTQITRWEFASGGFPAQMWLAEGKLDIALDSTGYVWDLAASQIIVEEAGGMFTDLAGAPTPWSGNAVVTNKVLHQAVMNRLSEADTGQGS
jgi:histidinol-phosphatase